MYKIIYFGAGIVFTVFAFAAALFKIAKEDMDDLADESM